MKQHRGWTLIELVLTIFLMGIVGSLVLKVSFSQDIFNRYLFQNKMIDAVTKAKGSIIYSQTPVKVELSENQLIFTPIELPKVLENNPVQSWAVIIPQGINYDPKLYPFILGKANQEYPKDIQFISSTHHLILDTQTVSAYAKH